MEREKKNRPKIVAVVVAVVLIVALIVGMVSCSSGKATDRTDGTGEQLEHYPVGIVTKPSEGSEPTTGSEPAEPPVGTEDGTEPADEEPEVTEPSTGNGNGEVMKPADPVKPTTPAEEKPNDPVKPLEPKPTEPAPTTPKPADPRPSEPVKPSEPKPTVPAPTEPKPTQPKPTEPKPTEPKPSEPIGEHTHSYKWVVTKEPNCKEDGYRTGKCVICGYCTSEHTPRLGHEYRDVVTKPTCTEKGYTRQVCDRCGEDSGNMFNFTQPTGHSYNGKVTKEPTCSTEGIKTYTCCNCGITYTESIPTAHNWVHHHEDAEGFGERGIECRCGYVVWSSTAEAVGYDMHTYFQLFHVEQVCKTPDDLDRHSYDETARWVETKPAKDWDECSICGKQK